MSDIRALLYSVVNPASNEQYVRDQQALTELFKQPGFFIALQVFAADKSLSQPERLLASVITGRELKTKWRSKLLVPENQRDEVRHRLLSFLEEEDFSIARPQLGLLVAVARIELPKPWTNLPQILLSSLLTCLAHLDGGATATSSNTATVLLNTMWTINALVREWRTVKLTAGSAVMRSLEEVFYGPVQQVLELWGRGEQVGQSDVVMAEAGRYAFKILARFGSWHWSKARNLQSTEAVNGIHHLVHHTVHYAPIIQAHRLRLITSGQPENAKLLKSLIKHLRAIGKWWRIMIALDPKGFCDIPQSVQGIGWWWGAVGGVVAESDGAVANDDSDTVAYPKRFLLLGMLLFKDILSILSTSHPDIFTPAFILNAFHLLVDKLLPLTSTDLEGLEDEPEEWLIAEGDDEEAWAFEFRPCAERVLMALNNACRNFPKEAKVIEPELLRLFAEAENLSMNDMSGILRREAIYCALGRLARSMSSYQGIDFQAFLTGSSSWLAQGVPLHRIVKRRLAWLIGQWVSAEEEAATLPIVWQVLVHLVTERGASSDMAVNLSAVLAIKDCVDIWDFPIDYFLPHLESTVNALITLLGEASTLGGKRYVNDTIGVVIERVGNKILPFLPTLAQAIPALWHGCSGLEGEWLFKASLVVLTTKLVGAAKETSGDLMGLVIPLIEESLIPPAKDFFEEDGLALWQASLYNAVSIYQPSPDKGLVRLLPGLLSVLGENMDILTKLLDLLDSCLLIDAAGVVQSFGQPLCATLIRTLDAKLNAEAVKRILTTVALLARTAPLGQLAQLLLDAGIFQHILAALEDDKASGLILAAYLDILSRIALADPAIFLQMVAETARRQNRDGDKVLEESLDALWRNFDYVADARMRKAVAMGAGALLTTGNVHCLDRLDGEFMNIFLDVLGEDQSTQNGEASSRSWKDDHPTEFGEIDGTPEGSRRLQLEDHDPAYATPLKGYVLEVLQRAHAVGLGPYWDKADEGTKRSLEKFLS